MPVPVPILAKKICSFDVGIKNLAYCILTDQNKIIKWDIINLLDDITHNNTLCCGILKNKSACQKKALFTNNDNKFYCGTHKENYQEILKELSETLEESYTPLENLVEGVRSTCNYKYPKKNTLCGKNATHTHTTTTTTTTTSINLCTCHKNSDIIAQQKKLALTKIKKISATKVNIQLLAESMFTKLSLIKELDDVNIILIENQPSLKNPTMKTIASILFSYFIMKKISSKLIQEVKFICPSNKLKIDQSSVNTMIQCINSKDNIKIYNLVVDLVKKYNNNIILPKEKLNLVFKCLIAKQLTLKEVDANTLTLVKKIEKDSKKYSITKMLSVIYTQLLLNSTTHSKQWLTILTSTNKKDDLCDSYLQAVYYNMAT